jgi:hypothetical protein
MKNGLGVICGGWCQAENDAGMTARKLLQSAAA